jgi:UDP-sugar transporter A1/2/3
MDDARAHADTERRLCARQYAGLRARLPPVASLLFSTDTRSMSPKQHWPPSVRYSRKAEQGKTASVQYNVSFVVTLQEAFKMGICFIVLACQPGGSVRAALLPLTRPRELMRIGVPAICFVLQNNILYVALSNLDPLLFQITYQIKTLLTALFSVCMLGRSLTRVQWLSQLVLMAGIVLVQLADMQPRAAPQQPATATAASAHGSSLVAPSPSPPDPSGARNLPLGLAAVLVAAVSSAFASVYFERVLKGTSAASKLAGSGHHHHHHSSSSSSSSSSAQSSHSAGTTASSSLWERNVELSAWTVPLNLILAMVPAGSTAGGVWSLWAEPLRGFGPSTWGIIVVNGIGGLLVAAVIKYADNIWKGFATAGAIVLTGAVAPVLHLGPPPSATLVVGAALVIGSLLLYARPAPTVRPAASAR